MTRRTMAISLMLLVGVTSAVMAAEVCHLKPGCCVGRSFEETYRGGVLFADDDLEAVGVMMQRDALIPTKDLMGKELYLHPTLNHPRTTIILPFRVKGSPDIFWAWKLILDCPSFTKGSRKK